MGYSAVNVEQIEGAGPGGGVRFVRRVLGIEAFGINWFELPPGAEGREHDETGVACVTKVRTASAASSRLRGRR